MKFPKLMTVLVVQTLFSYLAFGGRQFGSVTNSLEVRIESCRLFDKGDIKKFAKHPIQLNKLGLLVVGKLIRKKTVAISDGLPLPNEETFDSAAPSKNFMVRYRTASEECEQLKPGNIVMFTENSELGCDTYPPRGVCALDFSQVRVVTYGLFVPKKK